MLKKLIATFCLGIETQNTYKTFCHGDLTPNNTIIQNEKIILFDFANGGYFNFSYDLMTQGVYHPQNRVWKDFYKTNFLCNVNKNMFYGASKSFFQSTNINCLSLNEQVIKASLVFALTESFLLNFKRHQNNEFCQDGAIFLENIFEICKSIEASLSVV